MISAHSEGLEVKALVCRNFRQKKGPFVIGPKNYKSNLKGLLYGVNSNKLIIHVNYFLK